MFGAMTSWANSRTVSCSARRSSLSMSIPPRVGSDGGHPVPPAREVAILTPGSFEPADHFVAQLVGRDHRVDHQLTGQPNDVDVGFVLPSLGGDELRAL